MTPAAEPVIALDVGGTAIKAALLRRDGRTVLEPVVVSTGSDAVASVLSAARALADQARTVTGRPAAAAGVAVPGIVDEATGVAVNSANLGWRDVPLRSLLTAELGLPVALSHDVRAAAVAEGRLGAGRDCATFLFVAIGTGIASGLLLDGAVIRGGHGGAGELGHVVIRPDGVPCACGQRGCLETMASAAAIARRYEERTGRPVSAEQVAALAASEPAAAAVWHDAVDALADGLLIAQAVLDPETVAIGGGLARAGEALLAPLRVAVDARRTFHHQPTIVAGQLGYLAGTQGAGLLAFDLVDAS